MGLPATTVSEKLCYSWLTLGPPDPQFFVPLGVRLEVGPVDSDTTSTSDPCDSRLKVICRRTNESPTTQEPSCATRKPGQEWKMEEVKMEGRWDGRLLFYGNLIRQQVQYVYWR